MTDYKATPELWAHVERASNNPRDIATRRALETLPE